MVGLLALLASLVDVFKMMNYIRPIAVPFLCVLVAFGQLPALLHVRSCHIQHCSSSSLDVAAKHLQLANRLPGAPSHACRHASCTHHLPVGERPDDRVPNEHDSESCVVCQSLLSASLLERFEIAVTSQFSCAKFVLPCESMLNSQSSIAIASPRGPPVGV